MLQVIRLVNPGRPDKVIAFEGFPDDLLDAKNPRTEKIDVRGTGLGRAWADLSPIHFPLFYKTLNNDKERWQKISNYVRQFAEEGVRLMDKIEDMAVNIAPDTFSQAYDPEIVPIVKMKSLVVPVVAKEKEKEAEPVEEEELAIPAGADEAKAPHIEKIVIKEKKRVGFPNLKNKTHAPNCKMKGRGGLFTPDCARCDEMIKIKEAELISA